MLSGCLHPLTSVSVGIWGAKRCSWKQVFVQHDKKRFVILVLRDGPQPVDGRIGKALSHVNQLLDKSNPWSWGPTECSSLRVVAMEVPWDKIVGIDYRCPLHDDGKLVLEAKQVTKLTFKSMEDAQQYYQWAPQPQRARLAASAAQTPSKARPEAPTRGRTASAPRQSRLGSLPAAPGLHHGPLDAMYSPTAGSVAASLTALSDDEADCSGGGSLQLSGFHSLPQQPTQHMHGGCRRSATVSARWSMELTPRKPPGRAGWGGPVRPACAAGDSTASGQAEPLPAKSAFPDHLQPFPARKTRSASDLAGLADHGPEAAAGAAAIAGIGCDGTGGLAAALGGACSSSCFPARFGSAPGHGGGGGGLCCVWDGSIPRASRWTSPTAVYRGRTVVLSFRDPFLPQSLRRFVKSNMRLLKLYESGLPTWAVFMACYGLWYRPWMRNVAWTAFMAISFFSMACGFYDLYKNVPFLKQVVTSVAGRMYLPAAELFEWLERHTQIRLSILLTYLFSKSPLFISFMRMLRSGAALLGTALQPALAAANSLLGALGAGAYGLVDWLWSLLQPAVWLISGVGQALGVGLGALLGPPARALWSVLALLLQLVMWSGSVLGAVLSAPMLMASSVYGAIAYGGLFLWEQLQALWALVAGAARTVVTLGRVAKVAAPVVATGGKAAASAAVHSASSGFAVWQWFSLEFVSAVNLLRLTAYRMIRSAQAVMNCWLTLCTAVNQHRVSLLLQLRRWLTRQQRRLPPAMANTVAGLASLPSFDDSASPGLGAYGGPMGAYLATVAALQGDLAPATSSVLEQDLRDDQEAGHDSAYREPPPPQQQQQPSRSPAAYSSAGPASGDDDGDGEGDGRATGWDVPAGADNAGGSGSGAGSDERAANSSPTVATDSAARVHKAPPRSARPALADGRASVLPGLRQRKGAGVASAAARAGNCLGGPGGGGDGGGWVVGAGGGVSRVQQLCGLRSYSEPVLEAPIGLAVAVGGGQSSAADERQ